MSPVPIEPAMSETTSSSEGLSRFGDLRGVRWRINLGVLPSSASPIDDLRRVTANSRRRYAALRRQLLIDPHVLKVGSNSPDLVMDNPLSQNPDSMWGRFFKNAELERMVDQDLTRLYPEPGSYFQTPGCQGILRRILLLWCLRHPEYGYRQGMHELLAPLLYVLHVDVQRLSEVRKVYEEHFIDKFDSFSFHENDFTYTFDFKKFSDSAEDRNGLGKGSAKFSSLNELDPKVQTIILLCDAYGAEGELGIVLSKKFMEHDAYSMFDVLMSGSAGAGAVAMADFFSPSPFRNSQSGFPPVIEASAALYHLLSVVDSSLHSHFVELGVEPQYFALRWLRVLFGREFSLEDLLVIWDEIFAYGNTKFNKPASNDSESKYVVLNSPRGAFISAFAVSMILHLRSSVLATETATACLQRLLNFPDDVDLVKLLAQAKSLQTLAVDANNSTSSPIYPGLYYRSKSVNTRTHSLSLDLNSPRTPLNMVPDSYWEEKWRDMHKEKQHKECVTEKQVLRQRKGWSERVIQRLSRTESDPLSKVGKNKIHEEQKPSVRRNLLKDLARQLGSDEDTETIGFGEDLSHEDPVEANGQETTDENFGSMPEPGCLTGNAESEDYNSSDLSDVPSPVRGSNGYRNCSVKNNIVSNISIDENTGPCGNTPECSPLPVSDAPDDLTLKCSQNDNSVDKSATGMKERKFLSGKFQWLWKFAQNATDRAPERAGASEDAKACQQESVQNAVVDSSTTDGCDSSSVVSEAETVEQNLMVSLKNLGQSMLENIQIIESVFQQDRGYTGSLENSSKNGFVGQGQITAMTALKELRKMSNLLSEM